MTHLGTLQLLQAAHAVPRATRGNQCSYSSGFVYSGHRSPDALLAKYHSPPPQITVPAPARRLWPRALPVGKLAPFEAFMRSV